MKKWIPLIGLLTYSSVGWSEELVMECTVYQSNFVGELEKVPLRIFKMDTNQSSYTKELLTTKEKGKWKTLCEKFQCKKSEGIVWLSNDEFEITLDFKFKFISILKKPTVLGEREMVLDGKCETIG